MQNSQSIKVLIAEDIEPIRKRCSKILSKDPGIEVVAEVGNGYEAVLQAALTQPDVILMDIQMEERDAGLKATKEILNHYPDIKIIILTVYEDDDMVFAAFQLGVCDYMFKNSKPAEIVQGVKDAYQGNSPIRPQVAKQIRSEFKRVKEYESSFLYTLNIFVTLTVAEQELLYLLSQGKTRNEICSIRHVEMSTIKTQIHSILKKFSMKSISEVVSAIDSLNLFQTIMTHRKNAGQEEL